MSESAMHSPSRQRGMALISAILLLLVLTILSIGMFRSFGMQERIAGNTREKERANHAAESTQTYAEWWLISNGGINATTGSACTGNPTSPQVCSNSLATTVTTSQLVAVQWPATFYYTPPKMTVGSAGTLDAYAQQPQYYISILGTPVYNNVAGTLTSAYQVDAAATGGNTTSTSVVESTYIVSVTYNARSDKQKFIKLDGS